MPAWLAVVCALTAAVAGILVKQLLAGSDESGKPLAALRGEGFDIRMPGTPQRSEEAIPLPIVGPAKDLVGPTTAITYTSDGDDVAYSVSVVEGPTTVASDLQQGLAGMAAALGGSVRDRVNGRYRGRPAINARITGVADGKATSFVRIVRARKRVFMLQAVVRGKDVDRPPSAFRRVLASLRIHAAARGATSVEDPIVARKLPTPRRAMHRQRWRTVAARLPVGSSQTPYGTR